jgi:hypothetical protein
MIEIAVLPVKEKEEMLYQIYNSVKTNQNESSK